MAATGEIVVIIDTDCSMDPRELPVFVAALMGGADMVKGSRYIAGAGSDDLRLIRTLGNRCLSITANIVHGARWSELCHGFAAVWADVVDSLDILHVAVPPVGGETGDRLSGQGGRKRPRCYGHGFEIEALLFCRAARSGLRVTEVPSYERERRYGGSNLLTFRDGLRVLSAVVRERRRVVTVYARLGGGGRSRHALPLRDQLLLGRAGQRPVRPPRGSPSSSCESSVPASPSPPPA